MNRAVRLQSKLHTGSETFQCVGYVGKGTTLKFFTFEGYCRSRKVFFSYCTEGNENHFLECFSVDLQIYMNCASA